jgi:two-component system OmpR family sensor kinase
MSLRRRLVLTLAPLFIIALVGADIANYVSLKSFLVGNVDTQLKTEHRSVEQYLLGGSGSVSDGGPGGRPGDTAAVNVPNGTYAAIVTTSGTVVPGLSHIFESANAQSTASPVLPANLHSGTEQNPNITDAAGTGGVDHYRVLVDTVEFAVNSGDLLVMAVPVDDVFATLSQLVLLELLTTAGITLVVLLATWLVVRRGLRPLERMGVAARSAASDLSQRVEPATGSTEVGRLGLAINAMLGQLEAAFAERAANEQRLRHFVSDASHELRTPLTSMRGYAELLRRNPVMSEEDVLLATRRIEEETRRMGILVDDLLLLARLDQGRPLERVPVDLVAIIMDACADARVVDPARVVTPRVNAPVTVVGDDLRLRQVVTNIVRNALVHTPAGTPLEVTLGLQDTTAVIEVVDHGPGIRPDHAQRIFERFHRADPARSGDQGGSGLGLSIAAAVVAAHGGRIDLAATPGGGATFRIELPASSAAVPESHAATPRAEASDRPAA